MNLFPTIEETVEQATGIGWDALIPRVQSDDEARAADERAKIAAQRESEREGLARRVAQLYARDAEFRDLLQWMLKGTLQRPMLLSPLNLPIGQAYAYGQFREGQNAAVYLIFKLIGEGRKEKVEPRGEAT